METKPCPIVGRHVSSVLKSQGHISWFDIPADNLSRHSKQCQGHTKMLVINGASMCGPRKTPALGPDYKMHSLASKTFCH